MDAKVLHLNAGARAALTVSAHAESPMRSRKFTGEPVFPVFLSTQQKLDLNRVRISLLPSGMRTAFALLRRRERAVRGTSCITRRRTWLNEWRWIGSSTCNILMWLTWIPSTRTPGALGALGEKRKPFATSPLVPTPFDRSRLCMRALSE